MSSFFQNSFYIGNNFNWILYGVELVLYAQTIHIYATTRSPRQRSSRFFIFFSTALLFLITIFVAVQSVFGEEMWIINADFPGGAAAYLATYASIWYQTMGTAASVVLQLMSDGLLIYRCMVVWRDRRIIILPGLLWIATFAFGILELYVTGSPNTNFFVGFATHIGVTYISASIGLNVLLTSLICGRILFYAHNMKKQFGPALAQTYFSLASLIVESALPYTLCGIAFVVSYGLNSDISILFLSLYAMSMCLSPQMLILRVASGRAWNTDTITQTHVTSMQFHRRTMPTMPTITNGTTTLELDDMKKTFSSRDEESGGLTL